MFKYIRRAAAALCLAATTLAASGHEFWIMPAAFDVEPGSLLRVQLFHGERFAGDIVPIDGRHIERFEMVTADGSSPVRLIDGMSQGFLRPKTPGIIVYTTNHYTNSLPAERFEAYLAEEGLGRISEMRAAAGETDQPGSEAYARCAKSLVTVDGQPRPIDKALGLDLELVLLDTPTRPVAEPGVVGDTPDVRHVRARLLYMGKPLTNTRVVGVSQSDHGHLAEAMTDEQGIVTIPAPADGPFMLTTIHMVRHEAEAAAEPTGAVDADEPSNPTPPVPDWESFWASLTFDLE